MKIKNQILSFATLVMVALTTFSCTEDDKKEVTRLPTTMAYLRANTDRFSILIDALTKTGLNTQLDGAGSYTLFAPDNSDFAAINLSSAQINALTAPADNVAIANLRVILLNHVLNVGTRSTDLVAGGYFRTFGFFRTNAPIPATPVTAIQTTGSLLTAYFNLVGNEVLINGGTTNGGAKVSKADIDVSNGIIHEIDAVLSLPTIANHIAANPQLLTLLTVVNSTSGTFGDQTAVRNILNGATNLTPRTLMCPNNLAFTNATTGTGFLQGTLVTSPNVTKVLQYHLLPVGNRLRAFFTDNFTVNTSIPAPTQTFITFTGGALGFRIQDNGVAPNNFSRFLINDIQGVNGTIHIVDKVLQPTLP